MIDILIPTFNRSNFLKKNLLLINDQIKTGNLSKEFRIIVSDNNSSDETPKTISNLQGKLDIELFAYRQEQNIGPERNILYTLKKSSSEYVMYLGDDDYLPAGYLDFIFAKTKQEKVHCIIPGYSGLYPDGDKKPSRNANFEIKKFPPGFSTVRKISNFGHQMSGLLIKREGLYEAYEERKDKHNLYPFIFFLTFCMLRGISYYTPKYQVLVSQGNTKDWNYDDSGLLADVFKNYEIAFRNEPLKFLCASIFFMKAQTWRLRIEKNPKNAFRAFLHLMNNNEVSPLIKISLIALHPYFYLGKLFFFLKRKIFF